jgi:hypothetical protein
MVVDPGPESGFRRTRTLRDATSYRVTVDRAGRWHVAFAVAPDPIPAPGTGTIVGVDRGVAVSAALSTGELLTCPDPRPHEADRLHRRLATATRGSNRRSRRFRRPPRLSAARPVGIWQRNRERANRDTGVSPAGIRPMRMSTQHALSPQDVR